MGPVSKSQANYRASTHPELNSCGRCQFYQGNTGTCELVKGRVDVNDTCQLFTMPESPLPMVQATGPIVERGSYANRLERIADSLYGERALSRGIDELAQILRKGRIDARVLDRCEELSQLARRHKAHNSANKLQKVSRDLRNISVSKSSNSSSGSTSFRIKDSDKRYTFSVLYVASHDEAKPVLDAHNEYMTDEHIMDSVHQYVRSGDRRIFIQHQPQGKVGGEWVELSTWPQEATVEFQDNTGNKRKATIPAGSAWMGIIWEPWAWQMVKSGEINGLSFGGWAQVESSEIEED